MISENEFMSLQEGDIVQIVSSWDYHGRCHQDIRGAMDEFLFWNRYCIEAVCCDDVEFYDENHCSVLSMV